MLPSLTSKNTSSHATSGHSSFPLHVSEPDDDLLNSDFLLYSFPKYQDGGEEEEGTTAVTDGEQKFNEKFACESRLSSTEVTSRMKGGRKEGQDDEDETSFRLFHSPLHPPLESILLPCSNFVPGSSSSKNKHKLHHHEYKPCQEENVLEGGEED